MWTGCWHPFSNGGADSGYPPDAAFSCTKLGVTIITRSISKQSGLEAVHHPAPMGADPWSSPWPNAINP